VFALRSRIAIALNSSRTASTARMVFLDYELRLGYACCERRWLNVWHRAWLPQWTCTIRHPGRLGLVSTIRRDLVLWRLAAVCSSVAIDPQGNVHL